MLTIDNVPLQLGKLDSDLFQFIQSRLIVVIIYRVHHLGQHIQTAKHTKLSAISASPKYATPTQLKSHSEVSFNSLIGVFASLVILVLGRHQFLSLKVIELIREPCPELVVVTTSNTSLVVIIVRVILEFVTVKRSKFIYSIQTSANDKL